MKYLLLYLLATTAIVTNAQTSPQAVIERMNQSLLSIEKGEYWASSTFKSFLKTDTSKHAGLVQYFKTNGGAGDTLARFLLWPADNGPMQGSDGETYFFLRKDSVIAIERVLQKKGLIAYVSKGNALRSGTLSLPILTNKGHVPVIPRRAKTSK
jgi:hypothetical protein